MASPTTTRTGHVIAWGSFFLGTTVSIAANVLHAAEGEWTIPELIGAGFWPLALLLSVEVLTRVVWPRAWYWWLARIAGLGAVALVAFVLSYRHMAGLLSSWGEDWFNAHLGPVAVDGLMLISATALLAISRTNQQSTAAEEGVWSPPHRWPAPIGPEPAHHEPTELVDVEPDDEFEHQAVEQLPVPQVVIPPRLIRSTPRPVRRRRPLAGRRRPRPTPTPVPAKAEPTAALPVPAREVTARVDATPAPRPKPAAKTRPAASTATEEEAFRRWMAAPVDRKPSAQDVANLTGLSKATAARRIQAWRQVRSV